MDKKTEQHEKHVTEAPKTEAPKVEAPKPEETAADVRKRQLQTLITNKLNSVHGMESNIGHADEYWAWVNEFRGLGGS